MSAPKHIRGFEVYEVADVSTGHVTAEDGRLVTDHGNALPGVIASYDEGWLSYVPNDAALMEEHLADLKGAGFSAAYANVITCLSLLDIPYVRFDGAGSEHPFLPQFDW